MEYLCPVESYNLVSAEASNDQIEELIGLSFEIFTNTVLFVQNSRGRNVTDFLDQDDAGQKQLFSTLFNLQCYEQALELVKPDLKKKKEALDGCTRRQETTQLNLENETKNLEFLKQSEQSFTYSKSKRVEDLQLQISHIVEQLQVCNQEQQINALTDLLEKVSKQNQLLKQLKEEETVKRDLLTIQQTTITNKAGELERKKSITWATLTAPKAPTTNLDEANLELIRLNNEKDLQVLEKHLSEHQEEITIERQKLEATIKSFVACPTCFQPLNTKEAKEAVLGDLNRRLLKLKDVSSTDKKFDQIAFDKLCQSIKIVRDEIDKWHLYETELAKYTTRLEGQKENKAQLEKEIEQLRAFVITGYDQCMKLEDQFQTFVNKCHVEEQTLQRSEVELNDLRLKVEKDILPLEEKKNTLQEDLEALFKEEFPEKKWLAETKQKLEGLGQDLDNIQLEINDFKGDVVVLENLYEAFGKEGIVAELFKEYIPDIQQLASDYLTDLTNNELQIEFSSERILKRKVEGVRQTRAQFEISVCKKNGGSGYDLISGSEQNKAALVTNWALSDLACRHSNVSCNLRVFDEAFEGFDPTSAERLVSMILNRTRDSKQLTFVVTHRLELDDVFEHKILLDKRNGVSSLKEIL